jgi:hypothetical protein
VEASARTAGNLGFSTQVVSDATYAYAKKDYAGQHRSAEDVHNMALSNLDGEYASIIDTATLLRLEFDREFMARVRNGEAKNMGDVAGGWMRGRT